MTSSFYVPEMLNNVNDKIFFLEKFLMNLVSKQVPYSLYIYTYIYIKFILFLTVLGRCCCTWAFSSFSVPYSWDALAPHFGGFSGCGAWL